jgi:hypothetical protein
MNLAIPTIPNQSALHTIRTVLGAMLNADLTNAKGRGRRSKFEHDLEPLRQELGAKGDRLLAALRLECNFESCGPDHSAETARQWRQSRDAVERAAKDYTAALDRWRAALPERLA